MSAEDEKPRERVSLPQEVIEALEWGPVGAIKALRQCRGLGLYEAKLAIDAYLEQHPEHPRAPRVRQQTQAQSRPAPESLFVELAPVAGSPVSLELLPNRAIPPLAYVLAQKTGPDHGQWFGDLLKASLKVLGSSSIRILDEELRSEYGDIASVVVKIVEPADCNALENLSRVLGQCLPEEINWRLVRGCRREDAAIPLEEIEVEYFLREFSYRSYMVASTTNSVKLKHLPTGVTSRSTAHRRREENYEEALLLLSSLLKEAK